MVRKANGLVLVDRDRELRESLVEHLERTRAITTAALRQALLDVPRHRFVPSIALEEAYADKAIAIKERDGFVISSISQPSMIANMLELLAPEVGMSVLEIGTGSGYNAALLSALVGPAGSIVTVDIESDLLAAAQTHLMELGSANVSVLHSDALVTLEKPFDRIIVTARGDDIDPAWWRLLHDGGRIVVPLDIGYGGERAFGFAREGVLLRGVGSYGCAFLGLRGGEQGARSEYFFRNRHARYWPAPNHTVPLDVVAIRRENARPELLSEADVVIARPQTLFAVSRL